MKAADTSFVVAAFASWHESHNTARAALDEGVGLIAHCALETYSVLTRMPPPHRCPGDVVAEFLRLRFAEAWLGLDAGSFKRFVLDLPVRGVSGGASYDALIAATAARHGVQLLTCDRRAAAVYDRYGIRYRFIG